MEMNVDLNNPYVKHIAKQLGIEKSEDQLSAEEQAQLQGKLSTNVIDYYLGRMHMIALRDALEQRYSQQGVEIYLSDDAVKEYMDAREKERRITGGYLFENTVKVELFYLSERNYEDCCGCVTKADEEFKENLEVIQFFKRKSIDELERDMIRRKEMASYEDFGNNLNEAQHYYRLKDEGIMSYLNAREPQEEIRIASGRK